MRPLHLTATLVFLALPTMAWADHNPDFDDDATPILRMQPHLLHYVKSTFEVKDTGIAKFPGNDDRPPRPPFIFEAKPIGAPGPFTLRLLIQPGPPGRILEVVDMTKVHLHAPNGTPPPAVANQQPPPTAPAPSPQAPASQPMKSAPTPAPAPAPAPSTTEPTADTPSGPITSDSGNGAAPLPPPPSSTPPSLEPPPDPAPPAH